MYESAFGFSVGDGIVNMNITDIDSLLFPMTAYGKRSTPVEKICYSEDMKYCPTGFLVTDVVAVFHVNDRMSQRSRLQIRPSSIGRCTRTLR